MTKLQALKTTIEKLESGEYEWDWWDMNSCNCGLVAKTLLQGGNPTEYGLGGNLEGAGFSGVFKETTLRCSRTGIPLPKVFQLLVDAGFSSKEMEVLEDCTHHEYGVFLDYLKERVKALKKVEPKAKEVIRYVTVPQTINEQARKLILS